jgi:hypothetical protein
MMTIPLPGEYPPKLEPECVRQGHQAAMEEMVRQAIQFQEVRDDDLEQASLEALVKQPP